MSGIGLLDETAGAFRLLLTLYKNNKTLNTTQLQNEMDRLFNVKKHKTQTAIQVCASSGLIQIKRGEEKPKPATYHTLTERGKRIAVELTKIEKMLEEGILRYESRRVTRTEEG